MAGWLVGLRGEAFQENRRSVAAMDGVMVRSLAETDQLG